MIKTLTLCAIMSKAQAATKSLPRGQKTLERFFGGGTAPGPGKKILADGKLDSVKRKRSPSSKKTVAQADDALKHSIVLIEDSPPAKKLQTASVSRKAKKAASSLKEITATASEKESEDLSVKSKVEMKKNAPEIDVKSENQPRRSPRKKNVAETKLSPMKEISPNARKLDEGLGDSKVPAAKKSGKNEIVLSPKPAEEPSRMRTPERQISDDDDLFDIKTPEKKAKISLPDVSAVPAAFEVYRLKVKIFERNFSSGVNLIVADDSAAGSKKFVLLSGSWLMTEPEIDSEIFVFGMFRDNVGKVDAHCGFIVLHPQHLLSITTITGGLWCKRKTLLNQKFKRTDDMNSNLIVGTVAHEVFQRAVSQKLQRSEIVAVLDEILARSEIVHDLYLLNQNHYEIKSSVLQMVPHILTFMRDHLSPSRADFQIEEIVDIEDNLLCPRLGVRGKVDLTVKLKTSDGRVMSHVPLELKTGKPSFGRDHMAQVFFYTAMLNEKGGKGPTDPDACNTGILTYIQRGNDSRLVKPNNFVLQSLIQQRNELATSWEKIQTPRVDSDGIQINADSLGEFKEDERACPSCSCKAVCSIYAKMTNDLPAGTVRAKVAEESLGFLREEHINYVWHWLRLLDKESHKATEKLPSAFWMLPLDARVAAGNCIKDLRIKSDVGSVTSSPTGGSHLHLVGPIDPRSTSMTPNTYIALSEQGNETRVGNRMGFVHEIGVNSITLQLMNDVGPGTPLNTQKVYCVDKMNSTSSFSIPNTNLLKLLRPEHDRLRELVVDRVAPVYDSDYPRKNVDKCQEIFNELNDIQVRAVIKTLMSQDYLLLKGMPGTGKTTVIVATVRALVQLGHRVLVTSFTHNALDNILERLDGFGIEYVRIGNTTNATVRANAASTHLANVKNVDQVKKFYAEKKVFGATCLGTNNVVFEREKFDYCIVDEASQVLQPVCLGPILCAKKFLLVGDPDQLSPVILSRAARRFGMEECLFKRLQAAAPDSSNLIALNRQYRMNSEIVALSSGLVYENKLVCGNEQVAKRTLKLNAGTGINNASLADWQKKCVSEDLCDAVVFLDFHKNDEGSTGSKRHNQEEARLIRDIINLLSERGIAKSDIGVISTYQDQVLCLKDILPEDVESSTVDRYQGKEKEVLIMSCVRSELNTSVHENEIMNDVRRINVAISRARSKLILVGQRSAIEEFPSWKKLFSLMRPDQFTKVDNHL